MLGHFWYKTPINSYQYAIKIPSLSFAARVFVCVCVKEAGPRVKGREFLGENTYFEGITRQLQ